MPTEIEPGVGYRILTADDGELLSTDECFRLDTGAWKPTINAGVRVKDRINIDTYRRKIEIEPIIKTVTVKTVEKVVGYYLPLTRHFHHKTKVEIIREDHAPPTIEVSYGSCHTRFFKEEIKPLIAALKALEVEL